jgi:hypothetical protein
MVNIFRNIEGALEITDEAIALARQKTLIRFGCNLKFKVILPLSAQKVRVLKQLWIGSRLSKLHDALDQGC